MMTLEEILQSDILISFELLKENGITLEYIKQNYNVVDNINSKRMIEILKVYEGICKRKKLIVCFCCMLVMTASYNYVRFIRSEHNGQIQSERLTQLLQTDHNAVFLSSALRMSNILREMSLA